MTDTFSCPPPNLSIPWSWWKGQASASPLHIREAQASERGREAPRAAQLGQCILFQTEHRAAEQSEGVGVEEEGPRPRGAGTGVPRWGARLIPSLQQPPGILAILGVCSGPWG